MSTSRTDASAQSRSRLVRRVLLGITLVFATGMAIGHQYSSVLGFTPIGVDGLCPFGGLETLYSLFAGGTLIRRVAMSSVVLFAGSVILTFVFRRSFCGQICPLGALQGIFGWLGTRGMRKRFTMPAILDRPARYLKYALLVFFGVWTWWAADLVMRPYDAWAAWAHITSPEVFTEFSIGLSILGVSLAGSFFYDRFFCKYLCPMGAFLALFSTLSFLGIRRDAVACIDCDKCDGACPMNIEVSTAATVTASECISCNECVNVCPAAGALEVKSSPGARRAIRPLVATALVAGLFVGPIALARATGLVSFTQPTIAQAVERAGGTFDTSLIKGSSPMSQIVDATGIPTQGFMDTFGVSEADMGRPIKEIKGKYGFSPHEVRAWVAVQLGLEVPAGEEHGDEH
ncbi:MAG: 4Fe-4S binding protein [Coriobacteriia bacterium]|nr:4Fe-4S binding protein [Coriobacteriia bacterium]